MAHARGIQVVELCQHVLAQLLRMLSIYQCTDQVDDQCALRHPREWLRDAVAVAPTATLSAFLANYVAAMVEYACARRAIAVPWVDLAHVDVETHEVAPFARNEQDVALVPRLDGGLEPDVRKVRDGEMSRWRRVVALLPLCSFGGAKGIPHALLLRFGNAD